MNWVVAKITLFVALILGGSTVVYTGAPVEWSEPVYLTNPVGRTLEIPPILYTMERVGVLETGATPTMPSNFGTETLVESGATPPASVTNTSPKVIPLIIYLPSTTSMPETITPECVEKLEFTVTNRGTTLNGPMGRKNVTETYTDEDGEEKTRQVDQGYTYLERTSFYVHAKGVCNDEWYVDYVNKGSWSLGANNERVVTEDTGTMSNGAMFPAENFVAGTYDITFIAHNKDNTVKSQPVTVSFTSRGLITQEEWTER